MNKIFDTHAHYSDARFASEYEGGADRLLSELFSSDVCGIINMSVNTKNVPAVIMQAARFPGMYAAAGIHPTEMAGELPFEEAMNFLEGIYRRKDEFKVVAVGEIGLDYHYDDTDREAQKRFFEGQLELAALYGLPVSVHDRDAHGDVFETVIRHPEVRGVMHSYSGSAEMAAELIRRGWYLSFSGVVTFKNAPRVREVAASVPTDRLLLETDCPYLAPEPFRGKLNRSDYIRYTAEVLGSLHGIDGDEMTAIARNNTKNLFSV